MGAFQRLIVLGGAAALLACGGAVPPVDVDSGAPPADVDSGTSPIDAAADPDAAMPSLQHPGPLTVSREGHTATLLPSGDVLFAGGADQQGLLASAERYRDGQAVATGSMHVARAGHTATLLPSGKILVVGGTDVAHVLPEDAVSAELYDPATGAWALTGSTHELRTYHTATLLPSGKVLVVGGAQDPRTPLPLPRSSAELYDPATGTWTVTGAMNVARAMHTATLLDSGEVLVSGGLDEGHAGTATAELYDPATGRWSMTGSMVLDREQHTALRLASGNVLVVARASLTADGRAVAELYDHETGSFSATEPPLHQHVQGGAVALLDGRVVVIGGYGPAPAYSEASLVDLYDPVADRWTAAAPLAHGRFFYTSTVLPSGHVVVAGGHLAGASVEIFDPATGAWSSSP
jgi:hypothetical protein